MTIKKYTEEPREKHSVFWYGAIGIGIFGILVWIAVRIIQIIYNVGNGIGFGWMLKKYFWSYIPYSHPLLETTAIFIVTVILIFFLIYIIGKVFSKQVHNEALIKKIFIRLPLFKQAWNFFEKMGEDIHKIKTSPFVLLKDYPSPGFRTLGIITGKQIFDDNGIFLYARPCVFIMYSMFLPNGPIVYPDKEKIERIKTSASFMLKLMVSYGIENPDKLEIEVDLQKYYTISEEDIKNLEKERE